jgi:energy-converting hydrogenase A subunit P
MRSGGMSTLKFDASRCVRSVSKFSACTNCVDICPVETMRITEAGLPGFVPSECVDCGGCVGHCPSEALKLGVFDTTEFFLNFVRGGETLLSCRSNVPCLAALSVDHLVALALMKAEPVTLDTGHCAACEMKQTLLPQIESNIEEANFLLEAIESGRQLWPEAAAFVPQSGAAEEDRRAFLNRLSVKGVVEGKKAFDEAVEGSMEELLEHSIGLVDIAKLRQKNVPDKRKILFMALKRAPKPSVYHTIAEADISIASQKTIDTEQCTNCQMCYRICPTGALSTNEKNSRIFFDAMLCIKCRACHDTCETDALGLRGIFDLKEFFEPMQQELAAFKVLNCHECNIPFTSLHGEVLCPRCAVEEAEALELWGLTKKSDGTVAVKDDHQRGEKS